MYAINAVFVTETRDGYRGGRQVPTFFLDPNVQGITSAVAACWIARQVLDPMKAFPELNITAADMDGPGGIHSIRFVNGEAA